MDANMKATLARWGFRPVDSKGHPKADSESAPKKSDESVKEIAKKILESPDVEL